jgi:hypothetical protein
VQVPTNATGTAPASVIELPAVPDGTTIQVVSPAGSSNVVTARVNAFQQNMAGAFVDVTPANAPTAAAPDFSPNPVRYAWTTPAGATTVAVCVFLVDLNYGTFEVFEVVEAPGASTTFTAGGGGATTLFYDTTSLQPLDPTESIVLNAQGSPTSDGSQSYNWSALALDASGWCYASATIDLQGADWNAFDVK